MLYFSDHGVSAVISGESTSFEDKRPCVAAPGTRKITTNTKCYITCFCFFFNQDLNAESW